VSIKIPAARNIRGQEWPNRGINFRRRRSPPPRSGSRRLPTFPPAPRIAKLRP